MTPLLLQISDQMSHSLRGTPSSTTLDKVTVHMCIPPPNTVTLHPSFNFVFLHFTQRNLTYCMSSVPEKNLAHTRHGIELSWMNKSLRWWYSLESAVYSPHSRLPCLHSTTLTVSEKWDLGLCPSSHISFSLKFSTIYYNREGMGFFKKTFKILWI